VEIKDPDYEGIINKLLELKPSGGCDFCGSSNLSIHGKLYQLTAFSQGKLLIGAATIPLVVVQCDKCGKIDLFNAIHLGIVKAEGENNG